MLRLCYRSFVFILIIGFSSLLSVKKSNAEDNKDTALYATEKSLQVKGAKPKEGTPSLKNYTKRVFFPLVFSHLVTLIVWTYWIGTSTMMHYKIRKGTLEDQILRDVVDDMCEPIASAFLFAGIAIPFFGRLLSPLFFWSNMKKWRKREKVTPYGRRLFLIMEREINICLPLAFFVSLLLQLLGQVRKRSWTGYNLYEAFCWSFLFVPFWYALFGLFFYSIALPTGYLSLQKRLKGDRRELKLITKKSYGGRRFETVYREVLV